MSKLSKALSDVPTGKHLGTTKEANFTSNVYDYGHLLPGGLRGEGYGLSVVHRTTPGDPRQGLYSILTHNGKRVGVVNGGFQVIRHPETRVPVGVADTHLWELEEPKTEGDADHRGKGLGFAMQNAFLAHAKNALGATHHWIGTMSSMAAKSYSALAKHHGLDLKLVPNYKGSGAEKTPDLGGSGWDVNSPRYSSKESYDKAPNAPFDNKVAQAKPMLLKSELFGPSDHIHTMLKIPGERSLALKMHGCDEDHLAAALEYPELVSAVLAHAECTPAIRRTVIENQDLKPHWNEILKEATPEELKLLFGTCVGMEDGDPFLDKILDHDCCPKDVVDTAIDFASSKAMAMATKEQLDYFVDWYCESPNDLLLELAKAALANPECSESRYTKALDTKNYELSAAALQTGWYLPEAQAKDILLDNDPEKTPLRLMVASHPKITKTLLQIAASDKDPAVRNIAKPRLIKIMVAEGALPSEVLEVSNPEIPKSSNYRHT